MPVIPRHDANRRSTGASMHTGSPGAAPAQQAQVPPSQRLTPQQQAFMMQQMYMQQQQRFAGTYTGPVVRPRRSRNEGIITDEEWAEGVEATNNDDGRSFRRWLLLIIGLGVLFLAWNKYDMEAGIDLPPELLKLAERDAEIRGDAVRTADGRKVHVVEEPENAAQLEEFHRLLNVEKDTPMTPEERQRRVEAELARLKEKGEKLDAEEAVRRSRLAVNRQERLDEQRRLDALTKNFNQHMEQYGKLVHCGRTCQAEHKQVQLAFDTLKGKVKRELIGVLLDENVAQTGRTAADASTLKSAYEKKKEELEKDSTIDEEVRNMELAEIKDAYDILVNPEARRYYQLTGRKPPEHMKHTSTTHGGWGQELLLRTHKNRLILAWLDYFSAGWADWAVLGVIGFFGFFLPVAVQFPRILEMAKEIEERQNQMDELERRANNPTAEASPPAS